MGISLTLGLSEHPAPSPALLVPHSLGEPAIAAEPSLFSAAEERVGARIGQHGHEAPSPRCWLLGTVSEGLGLGILWALLSSILPSLWKRLLGQSVPVGVLLRELSDLSLLVRETKNTYIQIVCVCVCV